MSVAAPPQTSSPTSQRAATALLVLALVVLTGVPSYAQQGEGDALERARARIRSVAAELEAARADQAAADAAVAAADAHLAEIEQAVNDAAAALERQELAVAALTEQVAQLEVEVRALQGAFAARAASIYKRGAGASFEILLRADSVDDLIERNDMLALVTAGDRASMERASNARLSLEAERALLEGERERLAQMKVDQESLLAEALAVREDRFLEAAVARARVSELNAAHGDLEAESRQLESAIRAVQAPPSSIAPPSSGGYGWPVCARVSSEYGRRWGRMHRGIDIDGETGDAIVASKSGTVVAAGFSGGYGRLLLIDHGDGVVTAYAHLSSFGANVGQHVDRGEYVGAVGATGNATGSHLHFEIRVNGTATNPRQFLGGGCG